MFWVSNRNTSLIDLMRGYSVARSHRPTKKERTNTMQDIKWLKIDERLYELLVEYFNLNLLEQEKLKKYYGFRNDVMDLFNDVERTNNDTI